jgi:N-acetylglucosaminyl-diphospho-decaprenol L-rhamnosyltransferase
LVSYNTRDYLRRSLASIRAGKGDLATEIFVVDNNSQDGSAEMVASEWADVCLLRNHDNVGFARANNQAIRRTGGQYVLLLNTDTEVIGDALTKLVAFLDTHPDVAVVTSRLVYPDMTDQGVARTFPAPMNVLFGRHSLLTRLFPNNRFSKRYLVSRHHDTDSPFEVDWVSGACLMVRRDVLDRVGLLDEDFFMYWEDADLCHRIKRAGGRVFCVPEAVVVHHEGKSSGGQRTARLIVEFNKSVYRYYRKNHIGPWRFDLRLLAVVGLTLRTLIALLLSQVRTWRSNEQAAEGVTSSSPRARRRHKTEATAE